MQLRGARRRRVVSRGEIPRRLGRLREDASKTGSLKSSTRRRSPRVVFMHCARCTLNSFYVPYRRCIGHVGRVLVHLVAPIYALVSQRERKFRGDSLSGVGWRCEIGIEVSERLMRARVLAPARSFEVHCCELSSQRRKMEREWREGVRERGGGETADDLARAPDLTADGPIRLYVRDYVPARIFSPSLPSLSLSLSLFFFWPFARATAAAAPAGERAKWPTRRETSIRESERAVRRLP